MTTPETTTTPVPALVIQTADAKRFLSAMQAGRPSHKITLSNAYDELTDLLASHCEQDQEKDLDRIP